LVDIPESSAQPTTTSADVDAAYELSENELSARLAKSRVKDVYVYVHGVQNSFADSVLTIAEIYHFLGRQGVAIAYSWPAGGRGLLRGYNYDYNSSEFTVYHLKQMLRKIAANPDVNKIHILAHSRGTDALLSAVRELHLEISGGGRSTREVLKLGSVVLAAPDLDVDVVIQRAATARVGLVPERATIYICDKDSALGLSRFLFGSMRLGKLKPEIFTPEELKALRGSRNLAVVDARVEKPGSMGHSYFYQNPAVSSDLILLMRYHLAPGAEHGRPLNATDNGFWSIDDSYGRNLDLPDGNDSPTTRPVTVVEP
jgi:esterase/lipase superfamily enzyme